ncbi:MAG: tRNA (N6-threonylcarbamoyladenosine(37)-N6)-methyltransferase TrmO [Actinomycetota bacterium]|nr:tRNA (N6-threonylcarbamoyladenosine(37)-N6)-methyltransferase TrmO [Actinomycetota bacterium]MDD5667463.1 tRNA (N6-threonylcarbamoyladenosine(37)-N6)-methyltransferase TrmO [Actinomycetota bacterium]
MEEINCSPIGFVRSPFTRATGTPIQPIGGSDVEATVEILEEYAPGLSDLEGFSHIVLLYHFHHCMTTSLKVKPFLDDVERGVFATRAPVRPNHIGMSVVRLDRIEGGTLHIRDVDIIDGTPVLDIKPHIPRIDCPGKARVGWLEGKEPLVGELRDDGHFLG